MLALLLLLAVAGAGLLGYAVMRARSEGGPPDDGPVDSEAGPPEDSPDDGPVDGEGVLPDDSTGDGQGGAPA